MTRRDLLRKSVNASLGAIVTPMINLGRCQAFVGAPEQYSTRTIDLLGRSTVIDMLGLPTMDWEKLARWESDPHTFSRADLQKIRNSRIDVFHPAVELPDGDQYEVTKDWLEKWNRFLEAEQQTFVRVDSADDIDRAKKSGKIGILLGMQNSCHFRKKEDVEYFYGLGQRVSQLTYNARNPIGCGCVEKPDDGLTDFGASIVNEMNRVGMVIDVSHAGERTTLDAIDVSDTPVFITHSNCGAINHHPRCKSDKVIKALAAEGGVMGITGIRSFVSEKSSVTIDNVLDHYDHVADLVGIEHLGVGSDTGLDSREPAQNGHHRLWRIDIKGLNHPKRMFDLTEGLIRRGYSNDNIEAILGGNFRRALAQSLAPSKT